VLPDEILIVALPTTAVARVTGKIAYAILTEGWSANFGKSALARRRIDAAENQFMLTPYHSALEIADPPPRWCRELLYRQRLLSRNSRHPEQGEAEAHLYAITARGIS